MNLTAATAPCNPSALNPNPRSIPNLDATMKGPTRGPIFACLYPGLCQIARRHGYALAIHGTLVGDMDLIAAPWTDEAVSAEELKDALMRHIGACGYDSLLQRESPWLTEEQRRQLCEQQGVGLIDTYEAKPHGRKAWNLYLWAGTKVDLSVLPRASVPHAGRSVSRTQGVEHTCPACWDGLDHPAGGPPRPCPKCQGSRKDPSQHDVPVPPPAAETPPTKPMSDKPEIQQEHQPAVGSDRLVRCAWNNLRAAAIFCPLFAAVTVVGCAANISQPLLIVAGAATGMAGGIVIGTALIISSDWLYKHSSPSIKGDP